MHNFFNFFFNPLQNENSSSSSSCFFFNFPHEFSKQREMIKKILSFDETFGNDKSIIKKYSTLPYWPNWMPLTFNRRILSWKALPAGASNDANLNLKMGKLNFKLNDQ